RRRGRRFRTPAGPLARIPRRSGPRRATRRRSAGNRRSPVHGLVPCGAGRWPGEAAGRWPGEGAGRWPGESGADGGRSATGGCHRSWVVDRHLVTPRGSSTGISSPLADGHPRQPVPVDVEDELRPSVGPVGAPVTDDRDGIVRRLDLLDVERAARADELLVAPRLDLLASGEDPA